MKKLVWILAALLFMQELTAQTMWKYFSADDFAARRKRLMEKIGDGIAILQGAELPEGYVKFRQDNNFYYLSGVEIPGAMMILDGKQKMSMLLVPDNIPNDIKTEAMIKPGEAAEKEYKFDRVLSKTNAAMILSR
ncbi:MAG TPA: aminopeptidase P N-terminal domain-containing protein, partial [Ferruginibacter sp.]|nr:aminopeptidase P N-terminal domain-containing protein [Ferruginibacter sp.]